MSLIKTPQEIAILKEGGAILSDILRELRGMCAPGITTKAIDDRCRELMERRGVTPSFLNYRNSPSGPGYPAAVCVSVPALW